MTYVALIGAPGFVAWWSDGPSDERWAEQGEMRDGAVVARVS